MNSELQQLSAEWHKVNGEDIPYRILRHGLAEVRKALEHAKMTRQPVTETSGNDDSMKAWDGHKEF